MKENKVASTTISKYDYLVNAIGQRKEVATSGTAFPALPSWAWSYDALGQLTSANSSVYSSDRAYQYDAIGNRQKTANSLTLPSAVNYVANNVNQYTSVQEGSSVLAPAYDGDGNATGYPVPAAPSANSSMAWDAENRLIATTVGATTTSYQYDALSRRISKTTSGITTLYLYDAWNCIAEYSISGGIAPVLQKTYLWGQDLSGSLQGAGGVGGLLAVTSDVTTHFPTYDGNGNISEYLSATGAIAAHFEYDPFGNTLVSTDTGNQFAYRFSTKPRDSETGLYYYGYRYYDPLTGRWQSRDPLNEVGHKIIHLLYVNNTDEGFTFSNSYNSMGNQPINLIDSDGRLIPLPVVIAIVSAAILAYKVAKAFMDLKDGVDKSYEEGRRRGDALESGDLEGASYCEKAVDDALEDLSEGAKMPGVSPGGPPMSPKPFPGSDIPYIPSK